MHIPPLRAVHVARKSQSWCLERRGSRAILGRADNWRLTLVYGFAHLGKSLFWYSSEILFAFFLTEIAGLPPRQMGIVLATSFLVSAAIDLTIGFAMRHRLATAASASRLQLLGSVLCSVASLAVFLGALIPTELRFGYAVAAGIAFRFGYAAYDIPQSALMALATVDPLSRFRVASTRIWFSGVATLLVAAAVGPLVAMHDDIGGSVFLLALTLVFAVAAIASAWLLAKRVHGLAVPIATAQVAHHPPAPTVMPPAFWLLLPVMVATSAFTPAFAKLEPYFAAYTLRSASWGGVVIVLAALGILLGQPLWLRLCRTRSRAAVMLGSALLQIAALAAFGLFGATSPPTAALSAFVFGLGNGGVGMVQWAAFSEAVSNMPSRRAGPSYGIFAASGKIGLAAGGGLLAVQLSAMDFRASDSNALPLLMAAIPALGALLVVFAAIGLGISDRTRQI